MEDTKVSVIGVNIELDEDSLWLCIVTGIALPFGPNGQPIPIATKVTRIPFNKEAADSVGLALVEGASKLPDTPKPSDLILASSMSGVDEMAKAQQAFRSNVR